MARYFLHLRDGTDEVLDTEGVEYANLEALKSGVVANARDVIAGQVRDQGMLDLRYRIDAEDEAGRTVYSLPFKYAVSIIPDEC